MQCPVCRAENAAGPACRRCRADLSLLFDLERQRGRALDAAKRLLLAGDFVNARLQAREAHAMRPDKESRRVLLAANIFRGDFPQACEILCSEPPS